MAQRRFRFAPTPSRPLHVGSALAALVGWAAARNAGASFVLRIEDIDRSRCKPEHEAGCLADLRWLGLDWDEGPEVGGPAGPYRQSERFASYDQLLHRLLDRRLTYACTCSRAQVRAAQRAPHLHEAGELVYPGTCRPGTCRDRATPLQDRGGYRLHVEALGPAAVVTWTDGWAGPQREDVRASCGDFLLGRPGAPTYQLAVVADDAAMGVTDVIRGHDLLGSTARQILLFGALQAPPPRFAHHPLLVDDEGRKLSKRELASPIADLRAAGVAPERVVAAVGAAIGLFERSVGRATPLDLAQALDDLHVLAPGWRDGGLTAPLLVPSEGR